MKKNSLTFVSTLVLLAFLLIVPVVADPFGGPIGPSFVISNQDTEELDPAVAYNSRRQEYLTVFWNDRPGNDDIRAERVWWNGKLLGGFWVAAEANHDRRYPDVAYNDRTDQYLVVWEDYVQSAKAYTIQGRLISATGQILSDVMIRGVSVYTIPARPAVAYAYTSDKYLVVWEEEQATGPVSSVVDIVGQAVNSDGALSGGRVTISKDTGDEPRRHPDLAYNHRRNGHLVVWEQWGGIGVDNDIHARLVNGEGVPAGFSITISSLSYDESRPRVAAIPTATSLGEYLVVWQMATSPVPAVTSQLVTGDGKNDGGPHGLDGVPGGTYLISAVAGNAASQQFLVVIKGGTYPAYGQAISWDYKVWSGWHPLDSGPGADHPAIASGPAGDFLVAVDRPPFGSRDIYGQLWGFRTFVSLPLVVKNVFWN